MVYSMQMSHSHADSSCAMTASFCHSLQTASNSARACGSASKTSSQLILSLITENSISQFWKMSTNKNDFFQKRLPVVASAVILVGTETSTRECVPVRFRVGVETVPRLIGSSINRPYNLAGTIDMMLDDILSRTLG